MVKNRFGRLEDKFFRLIPKALAFRPIDDIKDFVYSYVLDEKEVNIDVLRENVRSYQDFQRLKTSGHGSRSWKKSSLPMKRLKRG